MATLYQQGTTRIEVVVKREDTGATTQGNNTTQPDEQSSGGNSEGTGGGNGETTWKTAVFGSESPQRIKRVIKTNLTHALAITKQIGDLHIEYKIAGLGYDTGDQAYQEAVQRQMEIVKDTTNVASSVAMGALYGSWGGPVGAVAGALFGGLQSVVSLRSKYKTRDRDFSYKTFKQENAIEYQRARANISLTTGRLR